MTEGRPVCLELDCEDQRETGGANPRDGVFHLSENEFQGELDVPRRTYVAVPLTECRAGDIVIKSRRTEDESHTRIYAGSRC